MGKALIIGGNGFVGGHLLMTAQKLGYECAIADISDTPLYDTKYFKLDITDERAVKEVFMQYKPDFTVNVAAVADIDKAENQKELAYAINTSGAGICARAAADIGGRYLWFSSDAVFDGENSEKYAEDSTLAPCNYYGGTKRLGEQAVIDANPDACIIRISLVLGYALHVGNSFVSSLYKNLSAGNSIYAPTGEIRTPIDVKTLCESVFELGSIGYKGVVHLGSTETISRYELTQRLAQGMGFDKELVKPLESADPKKAPRHKNGILNINKAKGLLKTPMKSMEETIKRALSSNK